MRWTSCAAIVALAAAGTAFAAAQSSPGPGSRFIVVLDAAHGGDDSGGRLAGDQLEKALTLALSTRLRTLLAARGIAVVSTRDGDEAVDPVRRAEIANHANAQACISLHVSESGSGIHLFVSSVPPAQEQRFAAWKTTQSAWITRSLALAGVLNSSLLHAKMSVTLGRTPLLAVDSMACPAVAIEVAPERIDHKTTAELDNADYQARVATALAAALVEWRAEARQP